MSFRGKADNDHKVQSVRNKEGLWINSNVFREEAIHFTKNGYYCPDPPGSPSYMEYWEEQLRRCVEGYEVGGVKITGHHYFYLNFTQIQAVESLGGKIAKKITKMPDFWDGDYNFFWSLEIAKNGVTSSEALILPKEEKEKILVINQEELQRKKLVEVVNNLHLNVTIPEDYLEGGNHVIVGKARRKGYSYKNAAICANTYNTVRNSITIIGAFDKKYLYPEGTMGMSSNYLSFLNKHTAWAKARDFVDKQEHKKASFLEVNNGIKTESGYKSQIMALSFGDNPDSARGKDAKFVLFEEAGKFPNLKASYMATEATLGSGKFITGQMIIFGTGGDMESGTVDFADMFYHPKQFNLMPFKNIWDDNAENSTCGFFHPVTWNMDGAYDEMGNSNLVEAKEIEEGSRNKIRKNSTSSLTIQQRVQEHPFNPSEAFLTVSTNDFPIVELRNRLSIVQREELHIKKGQPVFLYRDNETGKATTKIDLKEELEPIYDFNPKTKNMDGAVVIYEYPMPNPPKGFYKIGFDPYRQDQSNSIGKPSLACIWVYKSYMEFSYTRDQIVAQFVGRPYSPDSVNRIAELLAELYNTEVMYENEVTHVKSYFERKKKLSLLALQPDAVISKNVKNSKVSRTYGIHMNEQLKDAGEKYIKEWLLRERDIDENGNVILNLDTICDPGLLEELILYNRKGNFDRVMAFMMVMFQMAEEEENKDYARTKQSDLKEEFENFTKNLNK